MGMDVAGIREYRSGCIIYQCDQLISLSKPTYTTRSEAPGPFGAEQTPGMQGWSQMESVEENV